MFFLKKFFSREKSYLKKLQKIVDEINSLEKDFEKLKDFELKEKTNEFKEKIKKGESLDSILPEAFALVREAAKRTLKQRHFDEQLMGGIALHQGKIVEMKTGEGKTLAATLPAYLNALLGKGVHIVTVNDYLARRDTVWMGQIYHLLGLSVGCLNHEVSYLYDPSFKKPSQELDQKRDLLGSFKVFYEYLRPCERKSAYLADITYGTNNEFAFDYLRDNLALNPADEVQRGHFFAIIDEADSILIDEARTPLIISQPDKESPYFYELFSKIVKTLKEGEDFEIDRKSHAVLLKEQGQKKVERALKISNIYKEKPELLYYLEKSLMAEFLYQKDKDYIVKDNQVLIVDEFTGRILYGRRFSHGLHQAIEAKEGVPIREESKTVAQITFQNYFRMYQKLSGMTGTAKSSEEEFIKVYGCEVVCIPTHKPMIRKDLPDKIFKTEKAKFKAVVDEVEKCFKKGQPVLIGTRSIEKNEKLSRLLKKRGIPHKVLNAKNHEKEGEIIAQAGKLKAVTLATNIAGRGVDIILGGNPPNPEERKKVLELGGLHVIGTERHEARRIDDQLRGRAGRQGDPGSSQFFVSLEDELIKVFGGERVKALMEKLNFPEGLPLEHPLLTKLIDEIQKKVEGYHFDIRKHLLEFDEVLNKHRDKIYRLRKKILHASLKDLKKVIFSIFEIKEKEIEKSFDEKVQKPEGKIFLEILKIYILRTIDFLWQEHLSTMEELRESVRLQAYGQIDPLLAYKKEGHRFFEDLMNFLKEKIKEGILKIEIKPQILHPSKKPSRNDPCPCGSGKKYKKCCWPKFGY